LRPRRGRVNQLVAEGKINPDDYDTIGSPEVSKPEVDWNFLAAARESMHKAGEEDLAALPYDEIIEAIAKLPKGEQDRWACILAFYAAGAGLQRMVSQQEWSRITEAEPAFPDIDLSPLLKNVTKKVDLTPRS